MTICRTALESIFDECDRYGQDETGGRLIGTYRAGRRDRLSITVSGVIEPGPNARRTATSFFQDGAYQEEVFRSVERNHPDIEHLGNWHTHHVNGYPTLSGGDRETYRRTVNHPNHNTDFFYALLVTARNPRGAEARYSVRHFILYRGNGHVYEIPASLVRVVDRPAVWPPSRTAADSEPADLTTTEHSNEQRAKDNEFFERMHPALRPYLSKRTGRPYWRGRIVLVDDSSPEILVAEVTETGGLPRYAVAVLDEPAASTETARSFAERRFTSARDAIGALERKLKRELFNSRARKPDALGGVRTEQEEEMDVCKVYVGQGELAVVRHLGEAIIVDSWIPDAEKEGVEAKLRQLVRDHSVPGLILSGLDADHACPYGVDLILTSFAPDWVMYPKYYKETDNAAEVFKIIDKHEQRRRQGPRPLRRVSVRVDRLDSRLLTGLSSAFIYELFSPHIEDMDCSNNCSIVLKLTGVGASGFSYLITGDTENGRWDRMNEIFHTALRSDVLDAPHHGSKNATNAETILLIEPNTVLISAGVDNPYGHPDPQAVHAYGRVAKHVYATNKSSGNPKVGVSLFTRRNGTDFETQLVR